MTFQIHKFDSSGGYEPYYQLSKGEKWWTAAPIDGGYLIINHRGQVLKPSNVMHKTITALLPCRDWCNQDTCTNPDHYELKA